MPATLPQWYTVALPHSDIREGRLDESVFAANVWAVKQDNAPTTYLDPEQFFAKTYLTGGLSKILKKAGKTFAGYVEHPNSADSHNPWVSFPEGDDVERDFNSFPPSTFDKLPTVAFVIPNVDNDMHDGTIAQGDAWLKANIDRYAQWAKANNSLLVLQWDEADDDDRNHIASIFYGAHVKAGRNDKPVNHYNLLSTLLAAYELTGPALAANAGIIDIFGRRGPAFPRPALRHERGPLTPHVTRTD